MTGNLCRLSLCMIEWIETIENQKPSACDSTVNGEMNLRQIQILCSTQCKARDRLAANSNSTHKNAKRTKLLGRGKFSRRRDSNSRKSQSQSQSESKLLGEAKAEGDGEIRTRAKKSKIINCAMKRNEWIKAKAKAKAKGKGEIRTRAKKSKWKWCDEARLVQTNLSYSMLNAMR